MERLVNLPGVGVYVASAVLNFAFCRPSPLVDGNTIHLLSRLFELEFAGPADKNAWDFIASFELGRQNKAFYWGIIDLVAMVCLRRVPRCEICPLHEPCIWRQKNRPALNTG
jgi:A/G-specific adenine glycosylase